MQAYILQQPRWRRGVILALTALVGAFVLLGVDTVVWRIFWDYDFMVENHDTPYIAIPAMWQLMWALVCGGVGWRMGLKKIRFFICGLAFWELIIPLLLVYPFIRAEWKEKIYNQCAYVLAWVICIYEIADAVWRFSGMSMEI